jgi:hypothetical protein
MTKQPRSTSRRERQAAAEELAIAALGFIAGEPEQLGRFLAMTGIGPDSLREAARAPRFLGGVVYYLPADQAGLLAFAAAKETDPEAVMRARDVLTGQGTRHAMSAPAGVAVNNEPTRRPLPAFAAIAAATPRTAYHAARNAARRASCGIRNSTRLRSPMSTATPSMPRSRNATIRRSRTNR